MACVYQALDRPLFQRPWQRQVLTESCPQTTNKYTGTPLVTVYIIQWYLSHSTFLLILLCRHGKVPRPFHRISKVHYVVTGDALCMRLLHTEIRRHGGYWELKGLVIASKTKLQRNGKTVWPFPSRLVHVSELSGILYLCHYLRGRYIIMTFCGWCFNFLADALMSTQNGVCQPWFS